MVEGHITVPQRLVQKWDAVIEDMESTASTYRDEGWRTFELKPGHVAVLPEMSDRMGFDVLIPDDEFDKVVKTESLSFDEFKVFRESEEGIEYCLLIAEEQSQQIAVFIPIYYEYPAVDNLVETVTDVGYVDVHLHPLSKEKGILSYRLEDPALLFPHV